MTPPPDWATGLSNTYGTVAGGAGRDLILRGAGDGLTVSRALPWRAGACRGVAVADVNADGRPDLAVLVDAAPMEKGVAVLLAGSGEEYAWAAHLAPVGEAPETVGRVAGGDAERPAAFGRTLEAPGEGEASARLSFTLTEAAPEVVFWLGRGVPVVPDEVRMLAGGSGGAFITRLRVVDADGVAFDSPALTLPLERWGEVEVSGLAGWSRADGEPGTPRGSIADFGLVVTAESALPVSGTLRLDTVTAWREGWMPWLLEDFERGAPRHAWPDATRLLAGDVDGDGVADLVVLRGGAADSAPLVLRSREAGGPEDARPVWREAAIAVGGAGPFGDGALVDVDGGRGRGSGAGFGRRAEPLVDR